MLRGGRILITAVSVEASTVLTLVLLVAVLGPSDPEAAREYAAQQGRWVGPVAGFVYCVVGGWLVAKVSSTRHVLHGTILGAAVAAIDSLLLIASGSSFEILFVISNAGRLMAGAVGGMLAGRLHAARANLA